MSLVLNFLMRNWLHIALGLAMAFVVYRIDQNGYERAERAAAEREARIVEQVRDMEKRLTEDIAALDASLADTIGKIDTTERTIIVPTLTKEIASDPRFSDPAVGITSGMLDGIRRARALSASPTGIDSEGVPASGATD